MFKGRTLLLILVSGLLAFGAAFMANSWLKHQTPVIAESTPTDTESVVTAALEIMYGQKVEARHLTTVQMPKAYAPEGAVRQTDEIVGMIAQSDIIPGEILMSARFSKIATGSALASLIEPNMRAVTVRVNDVIGVAGFLLPGNRVDVLASRKINKRSYTNTILSDLKVLAVDQTARAKKNDPVIVRAVTLEVTPAQAETIVKARDEGPIQLSLRNPEDKSKPKPRVRTVSSDSYVTIIRGTDAQKSKVSL
ncbi:MAG: Flp pilus assembly protein CpaB [Oceanospirillales bacterium]|nr:Flp pilus assembly protein CpaB [Oceanospirillales bacterium]MBR9887626.1 Flp pilus assembly protein CpaB [Oceanospirillales bacterium]